MTPAGELLVETGLVAGVADTLTLLDPVSGSQTVIVKRDPPESFDAATSQLAGAVGNEHWVAWAESGFVLEHADWTVYAADRASGEVFEVAQFEPGSDGTAPPGWESRLSLDGDELAWSAPVEVGPRRVEPRIYWADLAARSVRRLDANAAWPALVDGSVRAMEATGKTLGDRALAWPVVFTSSSAAPEPLSDESFLAVGFAAAREGDVILALDPTRLDEETGPGAMALVHHQGREVERHPLEHGWGQALAGATYLAWSDQQAIWMEPAHGEARIIADTPDGVYAIAVGTRLWMLPGLDNPDLLEVTCPD